MTAAAQLVKVIRISEKSAVYLFSHLLFHYTMAMTHYSWPCCSLFLWNLVGKALSLCLMTLILIKVSVTKKVIYLDLEFFFVR